MTQYDKLMDSIAATRPNATLETQLEATRAALRELFDYADARECRHETTHRGGTVWTICDDCDKTWADNELSPLPYQMPRVLRNAKAILDQPARASSDNLELAASNNHLRQVLLYVAEHGLSLKTCGAIEEALNTTPHTVMTNMEQEYDALRERAMTPTMESIIEAMHKAAGIDYDGEDNAITITISAVEYEALCAEEAAKET